MEVPDGFPSMAQIDYSNKENEGDITININEKVNGRSAILESYKDGPIILESDSVQPSGIQEGDLQTPIPGDTTSTSSILEQDTTINGDSTSMQQSLLESTGLENITTSSFVEMDSSTVDSGFYDNFQDTSLITPTMIEEEQRLRRQLNREEERKRREYEKQQYDQEMKEIRYKRLMNLLQKSQFYANFMQDKVTNFMKKDKRTRSGAKGGTKRKKPDILEDFSEEIVSACKKLKKTDGTSQNSSGMKLSIEENESLPKNKSAKSNGEKSTDAKEETITTGLGIEVSVRQPKLLEGACLRDYQLDGLNWLKLLFESGMNGILADEMGLGKTVQVIALICHLYESNVIGPFLVVGPLSTLPNWMLEFSRFAPQIPVILYHGSESDRIPLRKNIRKKTSVGKDRVFPVILTSYEVPIRDASYLINIKWKYIIVDEGHRLKNYKSQLARALSSFKSVNRLLLTGTPLQNNLTELWSLLNFLIPDIFDSLDAFQSWFEVEDIERDDIADVLVEQEKKDKILTVLHKILSPFLLRRVKADVALNLPPKKEVLVYCPLSEIQRKLYSAILDRSIVRMMKGYNKENLIIEDNPDGTKVKRFSKLRKNNNCELYHKEENVNDPLVVGDGIDQYILDVKLLNPQMALRKTLNHPYLINMPVLPGSKLLRIDEGIVTDSGKVLVLDGLLARLKKDNHKVIIFSTFTTILDLLEEFVIMRGYDYERLDGKRNLEERKTSIYRFNTDDNVFVFLISTRAGGLGVNLTAADTAIIFDSDWNPQADLQAQDRCHRIGQVRPVVVYRFIAEGTLDEKIFSRASAKRKLEKLIIHGGHFNNSWKGRNNKMDTLDLEELKELLNSTQENSKLRTDGSVMTEEEWNILLDRSDLLAAMKENTT